MNINLVQQEPHPVYEAEGFTPSALNKLLDWLYDEDKALPEDLSLSFRGGMYRFRTREERLQFLAGMTVLL
jgi:hypothetical protein